MPVISISLLAVGFRLHTDTYWRCILGFGHGDFLAVSLKAHNLSNPVIEYSNTCFIDASSAI